MKYNFEIICYLKLVMTDTRGSRSIYDKIISVNEIKLPGGWTRDLGVISDKEWKIYNTNLNYMSEIKLKDFQYNINNKILVTTSFLYKINRKETNHCVYGKKETEPI